MLNERSRNLFTLIPELFNPQFLRFNNGTKLILIFYENLFNFQLSGHERV